MTHYTSPTKIWGHLDRVYAWEKGAKSGPVTLEWDLTNRCSRGCYFCSYAHVHSRGPLAKKRTHDTGDEADLVMVQRALSEAKETGVLGVIWTGGGEPTLYPHFNTVISEASKQGLSQGLYTHGGHIDVFRAQLLQSTHDWVVVSLDYGDALSYSKAKGVPTSAFGDVMEGIQRLVTCKNKATVGVSFLVGKDNAMHLDRMLEVGLSTGADYVSFRPQIVTRTPTSPDSPAFKDVAWIDLILSQLRWLAENPQVECDVERFLAYRHWSAERGYAVCLGIRHSASVTPDGRVWVCTNRRGVEGSCLGDLHSQSFGEIWSHHPGRWTDFSQCRAMCRLHQVNLQLAAIQQKHSHHHFV